MKYIVIAIAIAILAGCGGNNKSASDDTSTYVADAPTGPPPEQRCVDLWNGPNNPGRMIGNSSHYVSVGYAANYPDLCLVTISKPDMGAAFQFLEVTDPNMAQVSVYNERQVNPNTLDSSVTQWNAFTNASGYMSLL